MMSFAGEMERQDVEQDLLIHLMTLYLRIQSFAPPECTERIRSFNPARCGGSGPPRKSFGWLKMILNRRYTELAFPAYVAQGEPELVPVMHALASCITYRAAMKRVGMSQFVLTQARNRLAVMYRCFERWCRSAQVE
jgi:hypothetical protein